MRNIDLLLLANLIYFKFPRKMAHKQVLRRFLFILLYLFSKTCISQSYWFTEGLLAVFVWFCPQQRLSYVFFIFTHVVTDCLGQFNKLKTELPSNHTSQHFGLESIRRKKKTRKRRRRKRRRRTRDKCRPYVWLFSSSLAISQKKLIRIFPSSSIHLKLKFRWGKCIDIILDFFDVPKKPKSSLVTTMSTQSLIFLQKPHRLRVRHFLCFRLGLNARRRLDRRVVSKAASTERSTRRPSRALGPLIS